MTTADHDPAADDVQLDEGELARSKVDLARALREVAEATRSLSAAFEALAADPAPYRRIREELDRLDAERRAVLERLGEIASRVLTLGAAPAESAAVEPVAATPPEEPPAEKDEDEVEVEVESPPPLSQEDVAAALQTSPRAEKEPPRSGAADDRGSLLSLANHVVINDVAPADLDEEIASLERATAEARVAQWKKMSEPAQVRWVRILVAWAKTLEQEAQARREGEARVGAVFRRLRVFSKYDSPGYIHGFARDALPDGESWRADAVEMLAGLRGRPRVGQKLKPAAVVYSEPESEQERESRIPDDWAHLPRLRGKDVVMLGGEAREEGRLALEEAFQCASLTWVPHNRPRLLQSLSERAGQGSVDMILVNKFVAHKETAALERVSVVPIIVVRHGYGVTAVRTAIEEYFSGKK